MRGEGTRTGDALPEQGDSGEGEWRNFVLEKVGVAVERFGEEDSMRDMDHAVRGIHETRTGGDSVRRICDTLLRAIREDDSILITAYSRHEPDSKLKAIISRLLEVHRMTAHKEAYINDEVGKEMLETGVRRFLGWFFDYGPEMDDERAQLWMKRQSSHYVVAWVAKDGKVWHYQPMSGAVGLECVYETSSVEEAVRAIASGVASVMRE